MNLAEYALKNSVVTWVVTLVVARLLTPEDYGLVGMAQVFLGLAVMVSEFGIGASIVVTRDPRPAAMSSSSRSSLRTLALA